MLFLGRVGAECGMKYGVLEKRKEVNQDADSLIRSRISLGALRSG